MVVCVARTQNRGSAPPRLLPREPTFPKGYPGSTPGPGVEQNCSTPIPSTEQNCSTPGFWGVFIELWLLFQKMLNVTVLGLIVVIIYEIYKSFWEV